MKNLTTAEGGALTWNLPFGDEVAEKVLDKDSESIFSGVP